MPEYQLMNTKGPDHNKRFEISVKLNDEIIGTGRGRSKKEAEKKAAKKALEFIKGRKYNTK